MLISMIKKIFSLSTNFQNRPVNISKSEMISDILRKQGDILKHLDEKDKKDNEIWNRQEQIIKMVKTLLIKVRAIADYHGLVFDNDNGKYIRKNTK